MSTPAPTVGGDFDDQVTAACELVGRTGARGLEVGYLHEDVPAHLADWWAGARYRGAVITTEHHASPAAALTALAVRLLTGAKCGHCRGLVALDGAGATWYRDGVHSDGSTIDETTARTRQCLWHRDGPTWVRGCQHPAPTRTTNHRRRR